VASSGRRDRQARPTTRPAARRPALAQPEELIALLLHTVSECRGLRGDLTRTAAPSVSTQHALVPHLPNPPTTWFDPEVQIRGGAARHRGPASVGRVTGLTR
jgi:hypothetical protein